MRAYPDDRSGFLDLFESMRRWVAADEQPSFAAFAYDDDFAYLCFGAEQRVEGVAVFDRKTLEEAYLEAPLPRELDSPGTGGVAAWVGKHAPMRTGEGVIEALANEGGAADGATQLMRVLNIELPYDYTVDPPVPLG